MPVSGDNPRSANTDPQVAGERNAHPRAGGDAVHHRNRRLAELVDVGGEPTDPAEIVEPFVLRRGCFAVRPRAGEVGAGAKSPALAGEDRNADAVVLKDLLAHRMDLVPQRRVQRVQLVRPIERHSRNVLAHVILKAFVGHGGFLFCFSKATPS
jgi:hypothetical protein